ncbi:MAG TPA: MaoC/PaaZ C-terminal domain-containing protein [Solirubrobacteraceae bacterium]
MTERALSSPPGMLPLFLRAGAALVPGASALPFVAGGGKEIPELELVLVNVEVERDRLAAYDRVCGFSLRDELPCTFIHVLAFPLHLALMTDGSFPFPAVGLVHIENRITQHRPVRLGERLSIRVRATGLKPHPRGKQFSLLSEARVGQELVWEEESVNLRRGQGSSDSPAPRESASASADSPTTAEWRLPGDLGRRYAAVSGDHNPIHLHALTARLFGFPSAIAHGMWTKARSLAALENRLPPAYTVQVAFKRPILLPGKVAFGEVEVEFERKQGISFGVRDARKDSTHLVGSVRPAS